VLSHQSDGSVLSSQATRAMRGRQTDGQLPAAYGVAIGIGSVVAVAGHVWFWRRRRGSSWRS
jgi:hypothetical protein